MSPSKLHANLAAGSRLYVGPEGSNVDEAIRRHDVGPQPPPRRREGRRRGRSASSPPTTAPAPRARQAFEDALQRRRDAPRRSTACSTALDR